MPNMLSTSESDLIFMFLLLRQAIRFVQRGAIVGHDRNKCSIDSAPISQKEHIGECIFSNFLKETVGCMGAKHVHAHSFMVAPDFKRLSLQTFK